MQPEDSEAKTTATGPPPPNNIGGLDAAGLGYQAGAMPPAYAVAEPDSADRREPGAAWRPGIRAEGVPPEFARIRRSTILLADSLDQIILDAGQGATTTLRRIR